MPSPVIFAAQNDAVALAGRLVGLLVAGLRLDHVPEVLVDPLVGDLERGLLDLDALQLRQFELRLDLDLEAERQFALVRQLDRIEVDVRLADGLEGRPVRWRRRGASPIRLLRTSCETSLPKRFSIRASRGAPHAEARHLGGVAQLAVHLVHLQGDRLGGDGGR